MFCVVSTSFDEMQGRPPQVDPRLLKALPPDVQREVHKHEQDIAGLAELEDRWRAHLIYRRKASNAYLDEIDWTNASSVQHWRKLVDRTKECEAIVADIRKGWGAAKYDLGDLVLSAVHEMYGLNEGSVS